MEGSSLYQIRSKEEEHVFRIFYFLSIFLEENLERASRGWEGSWKDDIFLTWKEDYVFVKEHLFEIILSIYFCLKCGTGMENQAENLYLFVLEIFALTWCMSLTEFLVPMKGSIVSMSH